jgi:hypothetical protein
MVALRRTFRDWRQRQEHRDRTSPSALTCGFKDIQPVERVTSMNSVHLTIETWRKHHHNVMLESIFGATEDINESILRYAFIVGGRREVR